MKYISGRKQFEKYKNMINLSVMCIKLFPSEFRERLLLYYQMRNGKIGIIMRYILVKSLALKVGDNVSIFPGVYFKYIQNLSIGDNVSIHQMCYLDAEGGITIGNNTSIAHGVSILSSNHRYDKKEIPIKYQGMICKKTIIENNVWIGCKSSILSGVTIASGCVVGANTVVTRSTESNRILAGNPARVLKGRFYN